MQTSDHGLRAWGVPGALLAATFAIWMLFFPDLIAPRFAWVVEPRLAQAFIGAGYIFRTGFFLSFVREPSWHRMRWAFWGNLTFTGTLLLATFWHVEDFNWFFVMAHVWIVLYVLEPITMIYTVPRTEEADYETPKPAGPLQRGLKWLLVAEVTILSTIGSLLIISPEFMDLRWPWPLNPLDARIIAAWFLGWAVWAGSMAFARDWDEIRIGVQLNILFGLAVLATIIAFRTRFDFTFVTTQAYSVGTLLITLGLTFFYWRQETSAIPRDIS